MKNIILIGLGGFGIRHFHSLCSIDYPTTLHLVDSSDESILTAKEYLKTIKNESLTVVFYKTLETLSGMMDVAIIATGSKPRFELLETLLKQCCVKNIILEKFMFPTLKQYVLTEKLINKHHCNIWINCARREWSFYKELKKEFSMEDKLSFYVTGSNWGLGCNGIHFLDLAVFLAGDFSELAMQGTLLDKESISSKRNGYIEFTGTIEGTSKKLNRISITSFKDAHAPLTIAVHGDNINCYIREYQGLASMSKLVDGVWETNEIAFETPFQSSLTKKVITSILEHGNCNLTKFDESKVLHNALLVPLIGFLSLSSGKEVEECLIT